MVHKTSRVAYSFNYTKGGLLSLKAERTKTATLKCWEHTALARHEAPGAQNNKLISSFEHLWTWFCNFICFWSTLHGNIFMLYRNYVFWISPRVRWVILYPWQCIVLVLGLLGCFIHFVHCFQYFIIHEQEHSFLRKCIYSFLAHRRLLNKDKW